MKFTLVMLATLMCLNVSAGVFSSQALNMDRYVLALNEINEVSLSKLAPTTKRMKALNKINQLEARLKNEIDLENIFYGSMIREGQARINEAKSLAQKYEFKKLSELTLKTKKQIRAVSTGKL